MSAAGVIVKYGNTILLCKRSRSCNFAGHWSIPAGAVEADELPIEAAERELFEETKIKIKSPLSFVAEVDGIRSSSRGREAFYIYKYDAPELLFPILDFEHTEYGWFLFENLPNPMCKNIIKSIKKCF